MWRSATSGVEYVALAQGGQAALFFKAVLKFLQRQLAGREIDVCEHNPAFVLSSVGRTEHINARCHNIQDLAARNV